MTICGVSTGAWQEPSPASHASGLVGADEAAGDDQQQRDAQRGESHGAVDAKRHDGVRFALWIADGTRV